MRESERDKGEVDRPVGSKAAYAPPRLQVYGHFKELTNQVGVTGTADGGANPNHSRTR